MLLAVTMVALAWVVPLTFLRRIVPSESATAFVLTFGLLCTLFLLNKVG